MNESRNQEEWMNEWILMSKRAIKASFKTEKFQEKFTPKFKINRTIQAYKNVDTPSSKSKWQFI